MKKLRYACLKACRVLTVLRKRTQHQAVTGKTSFIKLIVNEAYSVRGNYPVNISLKITFPKDSNTTTDHVMAAEPLCSC